MMNQYRYFKWDKERNLIFLGENITERMIMPNEEEVFPDVDDTEKDWEVSEIHWPNPKAFTKPDGTEYHPDPIVILRPAT